VNYFEFLGRCEIISSATAFYSVQEMTVISHAYPQSCEKQYPRLQNIKAGIALRIGF